MSFRKCDTLIEFEQDSLTKIIFYNNENSFKSMKVWVVGFKGFFYKHFSISA